MHRLGGGAEGSAAGSHCVRERMVVTGVQVTLGKESSPVAEAPGCRSVDEEHASQAALLENIYWQHRLSNQSSVQHLYNVWAILMALVAVSVCFAYNSTNYASWDITWDSEYASRPPAPAFSCTFHHCPVRTGTIREYVDGWELDGQLEMGMAAIQAAAVVIMKVTMPQHGWFQLSPQNWYWVSAWFFWVLFACACFFLGKLDAGSQAIPKSVLEMVMIPLLSLMIAYMLQVVTFWMYSIWV